VRKLDEELQGYLLDMDLQPELILLRQLRCLLTREYSVAALVYVWDFIFSGVTDQGRQIMHG
jgi:hypothetical protein